MYIKLHVLFVYLMEISLMQKNLHRKKRKKLEAAREMLEDDEQDDKPKGEGTDRNEKAGHMLILLTDVQKKERPPPRGH
ncbi:ATP-dependent RNA helicase [Trifolium pratense]|uniref:ATP-dependent RNA helicase n=1 Tax=Trifolium pratense TaxID=57577 RepID=A0A2K3NFF2_TRIPR|nr:ATP-dependent RNA helicase [Trifolium pratense]